MARVVSKKAVAPTKKVPQLLDTKSDYNNYSNLSYFISQYKRAVEIINECNTFYSNFLRNKLLTKQDIIHTPGINVLGMHFDMSVFVKNVNRLYDFFIYKVLSKEFAENLKKYRYSICTKDEYGHCGEVISTAYDAYRIEPYNGGIPLGNDYFGFLIDCFCKNKYNVGEVFDDEEHYTWRHKFLDKALAQYENYDKKIKNEIEGFSKVNATTGKIVVGNGKTITVKIAEIERFTSEWNYKTQKYKWKSTGESDTFVIFGKEELKMIEILKGFHKKYNDVHHDMLVNPGKYTDLWKEYVNTVLCNKKYLSLELQEKLTETYRGIRRVQKGLTYVFELDEPGEYVVNHVGCERKTNQKYMFAPVDYTFGPTGYIKKNGKKREAEHDKLSGMTYLQKDETDVYVNGTYSIDAAKFLNTELLNKKFLKKQDYDDYDYEDRYKINNLEDSFFLNKRKLQLQIEKVHTQAEQAIKKNADLILEDGWYYVLIDNTPYKFSDNLSDVKIEWDEEKNILNCKYEYETRRKKAPWPGWMPWIVTTHYYHLEFDCNTNEPISYEYLHDSVEEKCG